MTETITICLRHLFKNNFRGYSPRPPGWGDCSICKPDSKNGKCAGFLPVKIHVFRVLTEEIIAKKGDIFEIERKGKGNGGS